MSLLNSENFSIYLLYIHVGIVEKVHETSSDTGIVYALESHALLCYMNSGCVLENRDTPTSHCVTW